MKRLGLAMVAGSAVLMGAGVMAQSDGAAGPRGGRDFDVARMRSELGLSDDQVAQLEKMRSDDRATSIRRRADLRIAQGELGDLLRAAAIDEAAVNAKLKQVTDLQAAATRARVEHALALRRILSPEQIEKMQALRQERAGERRRQRGTRGGRPAPEPGAAPGSEP
ncbi:MAG TPA: Spy/CpxP family protein refolding chaperone [Vicinamibacteria bacterium]|nr:Spy/CpxP family protein refolding chaperone [Vicinamibacteria bacterium]